MICPVCSEPFIGSTRRVYCSDACKQRRYRGVGVQPPFAPLKKRAGDRRITCVPHAIATAAGLNPHEVYDLLEKKRQELGVIRRGTGWHVSVYREVLFDLGFDQTIVPTGTLLDDKRYKYGIWVLTISRHAFAFVRGTVHDLWDSRRKYLKRVRFAFVKKGSVEADERERRIDRNSAAAKAYKDKGRFPL